MTIRKHNAQPLQSRAMTVASVNEADRSVELVWTTGASVRRYDWWEGQWYDEALSLDDGHVDLSRLNGGAPLLNTHASYDLTDQIGVVEKAWIDNGEGRALVRFSGRDDVAAIWQDVLDGIIRNVSVGYVVRKYQIEAEQGQVPVYRAVDWQPMELSLVPIPADAGAGIRSDQSAPPGAPATPYHGQRTWPCEFVHPSAEADSIPEEGTDDMKRKYPLQSAAPDAGGSGATATPQPDQAAIRAATDAAAQAERQRAADIRSSVRKAGLGDDVADDLVARGVSVADANSAILDKLAARSEQHSIRTPHVEVQGDEAQARREAITAAVMHRAGQLKDLPDNAREYRGLTLPELARYALDKQGIDTRGLSRIEVVQRSLMGTTDFATALSNAVGRTLRRAYEVAPRSFTAWARKGTINDFRAATRVAISNAAVLEKANEHGEFKRGQLGDAGEQIQLATYGKIIGINRQVIINDDLDIFSRIPVAFAQGAVAMESALVYGILTGNPNMADGVALFHATHGNVAGAGTVINVAALGAGRAAMRLQKEPSSKEPLNLQPKFLIAPAGKETEAQQFITQAYLAAKSGDYNPFAGSLELVVEPRLDATSAVSWYLAADPAMVDTVEYAYLDGAEGLQTFSRDSFSSGNDFDGIEVMAREDFAAKAIDYRGLYKNPGA